MTVVGYLLVGLGCFCILVSGLLIASKEVRKYYETPTAQGGGSIGLIAFLTALLKAPPELGLLAAGLLLVFVGISLV